MSLCRQVKKTVRLGVNRLEERMVMSVSSLWFSGTTLVAKTDNAATGVQILPSGSNVQVKETGTNRTWNYLASQVGQVEFQGGAGKRPLPG